MSISTVTPSDLVVISLPPGLYEDIVDGISREIPGDDLNVKHIGIAYDSATALGGLYEVVVEVVNSKAACAAIAAVLCQWIRSRNGKKVRIRTRGKTIEITGLNSKDISQFLDDSSGSRATIEEIK